MAGNYVYPGGTLDGSDYSEDVSAFARWGQHTGPDPALEKQLLPYRVAAVRELFEEAGILLAYDEKGNPFHPAGPTEQARFLDYRRQLNAGEITLAGIAQKERTALALDRLHYYAHWITPEANPVRFDTRFFVALTPPGQVASPDLKETTDGIWIQPGAALKANIEGSVPLSPPTLKTLEDVDRFSRIDAFVASLADASLRPTVQPVSVVLAGETVLIYPWDPEYDIYRSGDQARYPQVSHGRPSTPGDNTTRLVYRKGLWLPFVKEE